MKPNTGPVSLNPNFSGPTVPLWATLQQYPQFGNGSYGSGNGVVVNGYPGGDSEYSSLQTKVQKRLTGHFTTLATFTWGKIMTDDVRPPLFFVGTHNAVAQDWRDLRLEHSISAQDVKYSFTGQVSYDLPVGKGRALNLNAVGNSVLGGWTANAIVYLGTGVPIQSPLAGGSPSFFSQRADTTCNPATPHNVTAWISYSCFAKPGTENGGAANPLIAGNTPAYLDHFRTQGARNIDFSIYKSFSIGEAKALRFDVSSFNLFNKPQFGYPNIPSINSVNNAVQAAKNADPTCAPNCPVPPNPNNFGTITNTINTPRQFQFGARFTF